MDPDGRIGIFLDGTWNDRNDPATIADNAQTNVSKIFELYQGEAVYQDGIGTDAYTRHICGFNGCGFNARVNEAYKQIVHAYNQEDATDEDKAIDIFGFSRGAAESRALVNKLLKEGIPIEHEHRQLVAAGTPSGMAWETVRSIELVKPNIRFVGLFDTVSALGDPRDPESYYHDLVLGHSQSLNFKRIGKVAHAVASDEFRVAFDLRSIKYCAECDLPENAEEVYFRGAHSDIGRGYGDSEGGSSVSRFTRAYIYREALEAGVPLASSQELNGALSGLSASGARGANRIHDSRTSYERFVNRRERTVYYNVGSESLTQEVLIARAVEAAIREQSLKEGNDAGSAVPGGQ